MLMKKLKSQTGASITFALLLFLVCAVVSVIVIVAGTTSAGRMSQLPRMDQRYYAVTSAAELLRDFIDGKSVTVEYDKKAKDVESIVVSYADAAGAVHTASWKSDSSAATLDLKSKLGTYAIVADASRRIALDTLDTSAVSTGIAPITFALQMDPADGIEKAALDCSVTETIKNGLLEYAITSGDEKGAYTLLLTFASNIKKSASDIHANNEKMTLEWKLHSQKIKRAEKEA